jgi:propanol-preferring alcohol dehydrogenase
MMGDSKTYAIPKTCKAGVVSNEGPDFKLSIEDVSVPEPGKPINTQMKACIADLE